MKLNGHLCTFIWDSVSIKYNTTPTNFENKEHPKVGYCVEFRPNILHDFVMIIGVFVYGLIVFTLTPIAATINAIVKIICFIIDLPIIPNSDTLETFKNEVLA